MPGGRRNVNAEPFELIRHRAGFTRAIARLTAQLGQRRQDVVDAAQGYGRVYEGRRASMVVDVIASRQRRYETRVLRMVAEFETRWAGSGLGQLATASHVMDGLRKGEGETIVKVAAALHQYGQDHGIGDDDATCAAWAEASSQLVLSHRLDPYVGSVKGIGPALFCYLRMRCGADGLKPDLRVRRAFAELGLEPPQGEAALLVLGQALANELQISLVELDQLLWWSRPGEFSG
jgi:hypothetical protein